MLVTSQMLTAPYNSLHRFIYADLTVCTNQLVYVRILIEEYGVLLIEYGGGMDQEFGTTQGSRSILIIVLKVI
jgi:hypothetical protein